MIKWRQSSYEPTPGKKTFFGSRFHHMRLYIFMDGLHKVA